MNSAIKNGIDIDLQQMSREELIMELIRFRQAVRESVFDRDSRMWSLLPEKTPPAGVYCRQPWPSILH